MASPGKIRVAVNGFGVIGKRVAGAASTVRTDAALRIGTLAGRSVT